MKSAACCRSSADRSIPPTRERGVALITAVLIVAIATLIATSLMSRQNFDTRRTANILHRDQAMAYALGAEYWAGLELSKDARANDYDHLKENWAYDLPPLPIDGGFVDGQLEDLQGRFNLNSVLDKVQADRFVRLCRLLEVDPDFIPALQDWIDGDKERRENGAEDEVYTRFDPPYRAANRALVHTSELLLVSGVEVHDYNKLLPYISALPSEIDINVNTASSTLLQSLADDMISQDAATLMEDRTANPYTDIDAFANSMVFEDKNLNRQHLTVASQYFLLTVDVVLGDTPLTLQSTLHRTEKGRITVIQRRLGPPRERILAVANRATNSAYRNDTP